MRRTNFIRVGYYIMLFEEEININLPIPRDWQKNALPHVLKYMSDKEHTVLCVPTGCHAKGTKILKFNGEWVNVEDVKQHEHLMGDDGTPRIVLELYSGREKMYKIIPTKGKSFVVNQSHILSLKYLPTNEIVNISVIDLIGCRPNYHHIHSFFKLYRINPTIVPHDLSELIDFTIEEMHEDNYYGFELNKNHLYVMEDFFVTHNTGKTTFSAITIADYVERKQRVMFVVDRLVLIQQTKDSFEKCGIRCDILQGGNSTYTNAPVVVASQQTLIRRDIPKNIAAIFVDECHILSHAMRKIIKDSKEPVIGLSATPFAKGLGNIFKNLYNPYTTRQATEDGVLVPLKVKECTQINVDGIVKKGGEFAAEDIEERGIEIIGDVVKEYIEHANNKAIAFCATIKQCRALAAEFGKNNISAAVFCAETTADERSVIIDKYTNTDEIMVLISVVALATGFDAPNVRTVLDCRPLSKSLSTYIQSIGRGLRSAPNKTECLLLDFTGNMRNFAYDFLDFYNNGLSSLDDGEKKDRTRKEDTRKENAKKAAIGCPQCQSSLWVKMNGSNQCLACGFTLEAEKETFNTVKENYEVRDLDIFAAAEKGKTNIKLWEELSNFVMLDSNKSWFDKEVAHRRCKALYKEITGTWGSYMQPLKPTPDGGVTKPVMERIKRATEAYKQRKGGK